MAQTAELPTRHVDSKQFSPKNVFAIIYFPENFRQFFWCIRRIREIFWLKKNQKNLYNTFSLSLSLSLFLSLCGTDDAKQLLLYYIF